MLDLDSPESLNSHAKTSHQKMIQNIKRFLRDESGVTAIEYGILAAAMAAAVGYIFSSDGAFISALRDKFQQIADDISGAGKNVSIK